MNLQLSTITIFVELSLLICQANLHPDQLPQAGVLHHVRRLQGRCVRRWFSAQGQITPVNPGQHQGSVDSYIVHVLKRVTRGTQLVPFAYLLLLAFVLLFEPLLSDSVFNAVNELFYLPPIVFIIAFSLSRLLKLCIWHKAACAIPLIPQVENYIDGYVFEFTRAEIIILNTVTGMLILAFVILAIRHFFHGTKGRT